MSTLLSSKPIVEQTTEILKNKCETLKKRGIAPFMKVILVGNNPASLSYIKNKQKLCEKVGAKFELVHLDEKCSENDLLTETNKINSDDNVHGAIVQLPLPKQLSHIDVSTLIASHKDIDGFHPNNIHAAMTGNEDALLPCTPKGVLSVCDFYKIDLKAKDVVIIGRSMIVGKPLAMLMTNRSATVTLCHSQTKNIKEKTKKADIIVVAIGKGNFLDESYLNSEQNQVLIDVGINRVNDKLCGDINFENTKDKCSAITPVPGGIGPLTVLSLIENLFKAADNHE